ncbi:MAG: hypothetical protein K0S60_604 [Evtepia sp.]|nr:hypothetical protein [Evtepia sp.]
MPGFDSTANNRNLPIPPGSTQIQNVPDPSRVNRSDGRTEQQDAGTESSVPRFDSNFQTFLQRLREAPDLVAEFSRFLSGRTGTVVSSGMGAGIAEELSRFMQMLPMDRSEFLRFLTSQIDTGTRFNGPLFSVLRNAYQNANSEGMRADILQFLKRYSDYSSSTHIEGNLLRNLNLMARAIPASWGNDLMNLIAQLQNGITAGDRTGNLKLLQGEILPYMSEYVGRTHDLGRARGFMTLLSLDISRYENGTEANLIQAFNQLKNYTLLRDKLGNLDKRALLNLLQNTGFARAAQVNPFANQLAAISEHMLRGGGGMETQQVFQEVISSLLVNESVYMTVNHFVIPMEWDGKLMFSELWVDPDAESNTGGSEKEKTMRFLFKLDIQSLGFFDMVLTCRGETVDLQIQCPEKMAPFTGVVENHLTRILKENGLQARAVRVKKMERPFEISEVFPKIFEGKDSVNVKV